MFRFSARVGKTCVSSSIPCRNVRGRPAPAFPVRQTEAEAKGPDKEDNSSDIRSAASKVDRDRDRDVERRRLMEQLERRNPSVRGGGHDRDRGPAGSFKEKGPLKEKGSYRDRSGVKKLLDSASTFGDLREPHWRQDEEVKGFPPGQGKGQHLPRADPFISSPYTRETKIPNKVFHGGNSAMEESELRNIDHSTAQVYSR